MNFPHSITWFCAGADWGAYASKMDRSVDAAFPTLGAGAVIPAAGNDGNDLLTYTIQGKRQRETEK